MRSKALAEINTMHSFAPFWNRIPKNEENHGGGKDPGPIPCTVLNAQNFRQKSLKILLNFRQISLNLTNHLANFGKQLANCLAMLKQNIELRERCKGAFPLMVFLVFWDSIPKRCKGVQFVDLGESFPTHIYLQNLTSI